MKTVIVHGVHITTPVGGTLCATGMIKGFALKVLDALVTMTNGEDLITGYYQVCIHQSG